MLVRKQNKLFVKMYTMILHSQTEPLFKSLGLLKLNDIFNSHILKFYFNFCHNLLPEFFLRFDLVQRSNFYAYNIRTKNVLHTSRTY